MKETQYQDKIGLFGITIDNVTMEQTIERICAMVKARQNSYVVTPNSDHVVKLQKDPEFQAVYAGAGLALPDGMPLVWISRLLGLPLKGRVTGADLFVELCDEAAKTGMSVFLLGSASQAIIEQTRDNLLARFPGLRVVGAHSPSFGFEKRDEENAALVAMVRQANPDLLFVGVGAPKQEKWIYKHREALQVPVSLGVGAAFDFVAGSVKRAPVWMQKSGLEWLYRIFQEPKRMFRRYLIEDMAMLGITVKEWKRLRKEAKHAK